MGEKSNTARGCRWCRLARSGDHVIYEEAAFVVLEGPSRRRGGYVTLVTKAHADVMTELPLPQMAAVLAALTKLSEQVRASSGAPSVQVRPHPSRHSRGTGHLHFHLVPQLPGTRNVWDDPGESQSAFASLAEAISH